MVCAGDPDYSHWGRKPVDPPMAAVVACEGHPLAQSTGAELAEVVLVIGGLRRHFIVWGIFHQPEIIHHVAKSEEL